MNYRTFMQLGRIITIFLVILISIIPNQIRAEENAAAPSANPLPMPPLQPDNAANLVPGEFARPVGADARLKMAGQTKEIELAMALGLVYMNFQKYAEAEQQYQKALDLGPADFQKTRIWSSLANLYRQKGDMVKAAQSYQNALQLPMPPVIKARALQNLYEMAVAAGDVKNAEKYIDELTSLNVDPAAKLKYQKMRYELEAKQGTIDARIAKLDAAVKANPNDIAAITALVIIYRDIKKDPTTASNYLARMEVRTVSDLEFITPLEQSYEDGGDIDRAIQLLFLLAEKSEQFQDFEAAKHYLEKIQSFQREDASKRAEAELARLKTQSK